MNGSCVLRRSLVSIALLSAASLLIALALTLSEGECGDLGFVKGADISFLEQVEDSGGVYTENGRQRELLDILEDHGFNLVRLRIWHSPADGYCDLESTLRMADRAKQKGLGLLLDIHYSDTWADPGRQNKPESWRGVAGDALADSVRSYTGEVMAALKARGALPDMVQIGNEVICGLLWDDGRVCGPYDAPAHWEMLGKLIAAAVSGVRDGVGSADSVEIMIHIDRGGDNRGCRWFFDGLLAQGIDFDLIGLSFYPWWHGTLDDLQSNLADLALRYGRDIVVVETAYPWTLGWHDDEHNVVGLPGQLHPGYAATVEGQRAFLTDLMNTVAAAREDRGRGVCYWAPDWISAPRKGSAWENMTLFDFAGEVLHSIEAFDSTYAGGGRRAAERQEEVPVK